jgi:hypothetical protein
MTDRKVPKMRALKRVVCKITCVTLVVGFFSMIIAKNFVQDIVHQAIKQEYKFMKTNNATYIDFGFDPDQFWIRN